MIQKFSQFNHLQNNVFNQYVCALINSEIQLQSWRIPFLDFNNSNNSSIQILDESRVVP